MNNSKAHAVIVCAVWSRLRCIAVLVALLAGVAAAQTTTTHSSTDGKTPAGMQAGNSAGSYALSGFDSISPFSGSLSFRLPLLSIGGRGAAGYTMTLPIERKWRVEHTINDPNVYCSGCETYEVTHTYSPNDQPWGSTPGYGAGLLQGRWAGKEPIACGSGPKVYSETLTRLTFTAPDGTEFELRDQLHEGKPLPVQLPCGFNHSRGTIFVTADGTSATFISDAVIQDYSFVNDYPPFYPSGYLLMRDGTRYRINGGQVEWIQDRQGNRVTIGGTGSQTQITDSLGRITTISYANPPSVPYDEITVAGVGGVPRHIRVYYAGLSTRLRAGYSIKTYNSLFAGLGGSNYSNYDPLVVSSVQLPDGRAYHFSYNSHGELARVELPTGGAFEYDFQSSDGVIDMGAQSHDTFGPVNEYEIYRRAETKRVYGAGGTLESQTWFSLADGSTNNNTVAQVTTYNAGGALLAAEKHYYYGSSYPLPTTYIKPTFYTGWGEGKEYKTETLGADGATVVRRSEQTWLQRAPVSWWNINYGPEPANDPRVTQTLTTLADSNQMTKQTFAYDAFNNQTDVWEYDYGTGAPPPHPTRHTHTDYLTTNPANNIDYTAQTGPHIRSLARAQQVYAVNTSTGVESPTPIAQSETRYDEYPLLDCDGSGCGGAVQWVNPGTARGNATTSRRWLDTNSTWLENRVEYDQLGNVRKTWDARTHRNELEPLTESERVTEIEYSAAYKHAYPTHTKSPVPDPSNNRATNTSLETWTAYDFSTGKVTSTTDANNQITHLRYKDDGNVSDPLDRLRRVEYPDGGVSKYNYFDTPGEIYVQAISYREANQASPVESRQYFDGLGRPTRAFLYDGTPSTPWSVTDTYYDALGRAWKTSNPYRVTTPSATLPSPAACTTCTTTAYDALGRVKTVTTPDNAVVTTDYSGAQVTVTNQQGKVRRSASDALGRLTQVTEPNGSGNLAATDSPVTKYTYDVMGNLRKVDQGGQLRYFMYDSLGRLIRARNPEQDVNAGLSLQDSFKAPEDAAPNGGWTLKYTYDANGNLATRTDGRGVTTTHEYDNLNRLKQTTYTDATPYTLRTYDFATNGRGRFYADYESSTSGTLNYVTAYDAMGRPTAGKTEFHLNGTGWLPAYTTSREYDKMGHVTKQTYPSGHVANYPQFDEAGRLKEFTGNLGDSTTRTYSTGIEYDEASRMKLEQFGTQTALDHKRGYNVRGQMCEVGLGTPGTSNRGQLIFYYSKVNGYSGCGSGTDNNGNVVLSQHWVPNDPQASGWQWFNQYYTYDSLNRIESVREEQNAVTTTGEQHFTYDRWGNRQIDATKTYNNNPALPFNEKQFEMGEAAAKNRLLAPDDLARAENMRWMRYDAAGNLIEDIHTGAGGRTYDAENRMTSAVIGINSSATYTYDAAGKRVRRSTPDGTVWQVYGMDGELLAEYAAGAPASSPQKEYGYRNGELLVTAEGVGTSASFIKTDTTTQGNWKGKYGAEGYYLVHDGVIQPAYVQWSVAGNSTHIWAASTTDVRALQKAPEGSTDRIAATAFSPTEYTIGINLTDGKLHRVALYCLDWDGNNARAQRLEVRDAATNALLDSREVSAFSGGQYVVWNLRGHVNIKVINTGGTNAVASGLFFDASPDAVQWLVTDHLGTPRMIADLSGSLEGIKRHDYLPFGEELYAGVGGRTTGQGYGQPNTLNTLRERWATYERDDETGLDYAQARYYSSVQGRFTSPDEFTGGPDELFDFVDDAANNPTFYADLTNPQSLNKYQYTYNNPLRYNDPTGHCPPIICNPVSQQVAQQAAQRAAAITAAIAAGAGVVYEAVTSGPPSMSDASCPSCSNSVDGYRKRKEREADALNIRNQNNSGDQGDASPPPQNRERPKPEATGTTSSGRPTDRYGNALGPSGREMIHNNDHSSRSRAKEAARRRGKGTPENHPNPTRGRGHFHPTGKDGKKVPNSAHENYPPRSKHPKNKKTQPEE